MPTDCPDCPKPTINAQLHKAKEQAVKMAKQNTGTEFVILLRANESGYIVCESTDERTDRLSVIERYIEH